MAASMSDCSFELGKRQRVETSCEEIKQLLVTSGVSESVVGAIEEHGLTADTIFDLTDEDLKEIAPRLGDRIKVKKVLLTMRNKVNNVRSKQSCYYNIIIKLFKYIAIIILILHLSVRQRVRAGGHGKPFDPS